MYYNKYIKYKNKYIKYKNKYIIGGSIDDDYLYLLSDDYLYLLSDDTNEEWYVRIKKIIGKYSLTSELVHSLIKFKKIKDNLKLYKSCPGYTENGQFIYFTKKDKDYEEELRSELGEIKLEDSTLCVDDPYHKLCQSHGGNLFEHSQWSAIIVYMWFGNKHELVRYIDIKYKKLAVIAAFFHDIGKGGDCLYNVYNIDKYNKEGDRFHPEYCMKMIIGEINYYLNCKDNKPVNNGLEINIKELLKGLFNFTDLEIQIIALISYMHWELGELNRGGTAEDYSKTFILGFNTVFKTVYSNINDIYKYLKNKNLIDLLDLLRLCILISCADITAGTNKQVIDLKTNGFKLEGFNISKLIYLSKNCWVLFKMNEKYNDHRLKLLTYFYNQITDLDNIEVKLI